eukprot:scaffold130616_cov36-Phaeocystis_antarctica.AAC.1
MAGPLALGVLSRPEPPRRAVRRRRRRAGALSKGQFDHALRPPYSKSISRSSPEIESRCSSTLVGPSPQAPRAAPRAGRRPEGCRAGLRGVAEALRGCS